MQIVPKLNLNKTPNVVDNGSIVCAKNICLDTTGSYIKNEDYFTMSNITSCCNSNLKIVGIIPADNELVIFKYDESDKSSHIYRSDNNGEYELNTKWNWSGGKITGGYNYNYKGQLVIVVAEYGVNGKKIPLKSWILQDRDNATEDDGYVDYDTSPSIPTYNIGYDVDKLGGNLLCGAYSFFIRFQIYDDLYTNWFELTDEIYIVKLVEKDNPVIHYQWKQNNADTGVATIDSGVRISVNDFTNYSTSAIKLKLKILDNKNYSAFQIGYVYKRNEETVGRILGKYNLKTENTIVINNNLFIDEVTIDNFYKQPIQYYNVHSVEIYNNRCYIANYEEDKIEDLQDFADKINVTINKTPANNIYGEHIIINGDSDIDNPDIPEPEPDPDVPSENNTGYYDITFNILYNTAIAYKCKTDNLKVESDGSIVIEDGYSFLYENLLKNIGFINPYLNNASHSLKEGGYTLEEPVDFSHKVAGNHRFDKVNYWVTIGGKSSSEKIGVFDDKYYERYKNGGDHAYKLKIYKDKIDIIRISNNQTITIPSESTDFYIHICCTLHDIKTKPYTDYYCKQATTGSFTLISSNIMNMNSAGIKFYAIQQYNLVESNANKIPSNAPELFNTSTSNYLNRTLIPNQAYKFFVHFIRKNGSATTGFEITNKDSNYFNKDKLIHNNSTYSNPIYLPKFTGIDIPDNYIGCFITYEKLDFKVSPFVWIPGTSKNNAIAINNTANLYNIDGLNGDVIYKDDSKEYTDSDFAGIKITNMEHVNKSTIEKRCKIQPNISFGKGIIGRNDLSNAYNSKVKTLYRLTDNIYSGYTEYCQSKFIPSYYQKEVVFYFTKEILGSIATNIFLSPSNVSDASVGNIGIDFNIGINNSWNYTNYPYIALSIKQDYQTAAVNFTKTVNNKLEEVGIYYNSSFMPVNLKDFLELKTCYRSNPVVSYTNYRDTFVDKFYKTVRRSNVFNDESLSNNFAQYEINEYRNIFENKGVITNLYSEGLYLLVHTEYSLYVFDRTPKITSKSTLNTPDTFDIDYTELTNSGLKDKDSSIKTTFGYIWFDYNTKYIYAFNQGKITNLSKDITNFLYSIDIEKVRFGVDYKTNRLLICITTKNDDVYTISYFIDKACYLSLHDYKFDYCYQIYNKTYFLDEDIKYCLYDFDTNKDDIYPYKQLNNLYPTIIIDNKIYRYVDLIFNNEYNVIKSIDSISYIIKHESKNNDIIFNPTSEDDNKDLTCGKYMQVISDNCSSDLRNIEPTERNKFNDYKYPYFEKGIYNINYFRDVINKKGIDNVSDNKSLIYGKYFIIRFAFPIDYNFKLEDVIINIKKY